MNRCYECDDLAAEIIDVNGNDYCGPCAAQIAVCENCHETVAAVDLSDRDLCQACEEYGD